MSAPIPHAPTGAMPAIGLPDSQDYPRLVFTAPYFEQYPLAELIEPAVIEAAQDILPSLVPPYVDAAAQAAVQQLAVLLTGSTMTGPLFLSPLMPTQPSQAATMAYVDSMIATAGIPEVPPVPSGQVWARETGQWVPITPQTGVFLPLSGGSMQGNINMSGNTIQNMAAVPAMPNGAAPAQWVLNQIASVSLYQGTWNADTNVPDLTQLSTHVNAYTWIAITIAVGGVVIGAAIPGLQGMTIFNGDTIIYSTVQGQFMAIHAGGLTLPEADERYVQLAGSQMSGALLLNANASQPMQAVTLQQLDTYVPPGAVTEAPNDGQLYGRNGLTASWAPVLPLAGGILTGALTLSGNATAALNPVPLQQMTSAISAATAGYLPLAGGTMSGLMTLSGNATANLNPVPLQQLNSMLGSYLPLTGGTVSGRTIFTAPGTFTAPGVTVSAANGAGVLQVGGAYFTGTSNALGIQAQSGGASASLDTITCFATTTETEGNLIVVGPTLTFPGNGFLQAWSAGGWIMRDSGSLYNFFLQPSADPVWQWNTSTVSLMNLDTGGNLHITGTLSQGSDASLKTNVQPLGAEAGLLAVRALQPKSFSWKETPDKTQWGFIAQDVEAVIPVAVNQTVHPNETKTLSLDTTSILASLCLAVQQLADEVGALKG